MHLGYRNAVVGNGYAAVARMAQAVFHLPRGQHAAAAVHYKRIFIKAFGEFPAGGEFKIQPFARVIAYPARQLYRAYVVALPVVRAAFAYKHRVPVLQPRYRLRARCNGFKFALIAGKKY